MAPQGTHLPQPSNIPPISAGDYITQPSTPVRTLETPRRRTRGSEQKIDLQTLPGTRWDELEIERQRERQRGREPGSDTTGTLSLDRLSLREKKVQVPSRCTAATKDNDLIAGRRPTQRQVRQSGTHTGSFETEPSQVLAAAFSPTKRRRPNKPVVVEHRVLPGRQSQPASEAELNHQSLSLTSDRSVGKDLLPSMARRPGRNQADHFVDLKETIHESLSKLSDIQEKLAPLGQQIVALEEELKAKESDSSKLEQIPRIL